MSRRTRGSLLFPLALVFLGIMFLLINLGVVDRTVWSQIVRYWPVLLILMGIDALLRRSSLGAALGTLISAAVVVALGLTLFYWFAPGAWLAEGTQAFAHPLGRAASAEVTLSCRECAMTIEAQTEHPGPEYLITGTLSLGRNERLVETAVDNGDVSSFRLESDYRLPFLASLDQGMRQWKAQLNDSIPLSLSVSTYGPLALDLGSLTLESVDVSAGGDPCTITLSRTSDARIYLSGERIVVQFPSEIGIRVIGDASSALVVPPDFVRTDDGLRSPDYEGAPVRTDIVLRPGAESVEIKPVVTLPAV